MIKVIPNFLSNDECAEYINLINEKANKSDTCCFTNNADMFNHKYINETLSQHFYDRFCLFENPSDNEITGPNNLVMMARYINGENFGLHTDTGLFYDNINKLKSRFTVLIYLNDDFDNGNTIFYNDKFQVTDVIKPVKGSCLIFDIDLWHEGQAVKNGNKYWIGCEFIGKFSD